MLLLHIGTAVVGFGGLLAYGTIHARAFRAPGTEARALLETAQSVAGTAHKALYALGALGIMMIAISESAISFAEVWVSAAFVVWFATIGVVHGLIRPSVASLATSAAGLKTDATLGDDVEAQGAAKKLALGEGSLHLLLAIALALMIWQPGS